MASLADVCGSGVGLAVTWVITQGFHVLFRTFIYGDCVVIATCRLRPQSLKLVCTCFRTIFACQLPFERLIRFVGWCGHAHNLSLLIDVVPTMRVAICA